MLEFIAFVFFVGALAGLMQHTGPRYWKSTLHLSGGAIMAPPER
jgi:hypothetical protein